MQSCIFSQNHARERVKTRLKLTVFSLERLGLKKKLGRKIFWVGKNFRSEKMLDQKKFGPRKCGVQILRPKKIGSTNFGQYQDSNR